MVQPAGMNVATSRAAQIKAAQTAVVNHYFDRGKGNALEMLRLYNHAGLLEHARFNMGAVNQAGWTNAGKILAAFAEESVGMQSKELSLPARIAKLEGALSVYRAVEADNNAKRCNDRLGTLKAEQRRHEEAESLRQIAAKAAENGVAGPEGIMHAPPTLAAETDGVPRLFLPSDEVKAEAANAVETPKPAANHIPTHDELVLASAQRLEGEGNTVLRPQAGIAKFTAAAEKYEQLGMTAEAERCRNTAAELQKQVDAESGTGQANAGAS